MPEEVKNNNGQLLVDEKEYARLVERDIFLNCLEGAGVDNWSGYDYAIDLKKGEG